MPNERRHFARISFDTHAELTTTDTRITVKVLDLSLKGALIQLPTPDAVPGGVPCLLAVGLTHGEGRIVMAADVAHVHNSRAGLLCRSIDLESITHLRRLIEVNLGDPALLERELKALVSP